MELLEGGLQLRDTRDGGLLDTGKTLDFLSRFRECVVRQSMLQWGVGRIDILAI